MPRRLRKLFPMSGLITSRASYSTHSWGPSQRSSRHRSLMTLKHLLALALALFSGSDLRSLRTSAIRHAKESQAKGTSVLEKCKHDQIHILTQVLLRKCWKRTVLQAGAEPKFSCLLTQTSWPSHLYWVFSSLKWGHQQLLFCGVAEWMD